MTMWRALPTLLLLGSGLLINSAVDGWYTWRQTEALMTRLHREKAETADERTAFMSTCLEADKRM